MSVEVAAHREPVRSDAELLAAFRRTGDVAALTELLRRHHRLVWGVCQQLLGSTHDAEDAYQATFLVLLRKSHRIRQSAALASWLYGVAFRVASRIRQRRARTRPLDFEPLGPVDRDPLTAVMLLDQQAALHAAIVRLPERLRRPVVLRYLLGRSNAEVAAELAITEAAVEGRLKRAKARLRRQLTRQGVTIAAALAALPLVPSTAEAADRLVALTVEHCIQYRAGAETGIAEGDIPPALNHLVTEEMASMFTRQITQAITVLGLAAAATTGLVVLPKITSAQSAEDTVTVEQRADDPFAYATPEEAVEVQVAPARSDKIIRAELSLRARPYSNSENQVLRALERETEFQFVDSPLRDVMQFFADRHQFQFTIDQSALDEMGISSDVSVSGSFSGISLSSGLSLLLRQVGLAYILRDEVLTITTEEEAQNALELRLYPFRSKWPITREQLKDIIKSAIAPDSWSEVGGEGVILDYEGGLMVMSTLEVHEQILDVLMMLSQQAESQSGRR